MKKLVLSAAIALGLASPAFANDQLAAALGVDADRYSLAELVALAHARESDAYAFADFIEDGDARTSQISPAGLAFALRVAEENNDRQLLRALRGLQSEAGVVVSTRGTTSDAAREFAIRVAEQNGDYQLARFLEDGGSLSGVRGLN